MIFFNSHEFWGYIAKTCRNKSPSKLYISTYNMRIGICNYNCRKTGKPILGKPKGLNNNQIVIDYCDILTSLKKGSSCIIIGEDTMYNKERLRIKDVWPDANIYHKQNHHSKVVIMSFRSSIEAWVGSMNLNDSTWSDVMVKLQVKSDMEKLIKQFIKWKGLSKKLQ